MIDNQTIILKSQQRLNKLASADYDNVEDWQIIEAFNKGTVNWCRRQLHGLNVKQTGDEQSKPRIDDLQILLKDISINVTKKDLLYETEKLPEDYFEWKRITCKAKHECCDNKRRMVIYLAEEANVDTLLRDYNKKPNFEWGETFCTLKDNKANIYTNNEFEVEQAVLTYYRQPRRIQITGVSDPYTGIVSTAEVLSEFKDDIIELLIDEAVKIIAGDIESFNQQQTASSQVESNN